MITTHQKLVDALEAMPKKELSRGMMYNYDTDCYCALGAMMWAAGREAVGGPGHVSHVLKTRHVQTYDIMEKNDNFNGTNEERHAHMLAYGKARA